MWKKTATFIKSGWIECLIYALVKASMYWERSWLIYITRLCASSARICAVTKCKEWWMRMTHERQFPALRCIRFDVEWRKRGTRTKDFQRRIKSLVDTFSHFVLRGCKLQAQQLSRALQLWEPFLFYSLLLLIRRPCERRRFGNNKSLIDGSEVRWGAASYEISASYDV